MRRQYQTAWVIIGALMLLAAILGPIVAIRSLQSADARGERASVRISGLQDQVRTLQEEIILARADVARNQLAIEALSAQIVLAGGTPVVMPAPPQQQSTPPSTTPPTTTTPTTTPPTTKCRGVSPVCLGG